MTKLVVLSAALAGLLAPNAAAPARLGVTATEFRFSLSRTTLKRGPAIIELDNLGEDVHDLRLHRVGGSRTFSIPETKPGRRAELQLRLRPGRYHVWCSVANHRALGMEATFRVR
jgi:plastocyanin